MHAELVRLADDWTVTDDGLSRNGTFVNDRRVEGRLRLMDGDLLRCGETLLLFVSPFQAAERRGPRRRSSDRRRAPRPAAISQLARLL